ncbi:MAG TPA: hypothetical protein VI911_07105 [Patescibacteria group bacterium]|nr:hypothetical protein [Patescibacteria group bacterium]
MKTYSDLTIRILRLLNKARKRGMLGKDILKAAVHTSKKKNTIAPLLVNLGNSKVIHDDYGNPIAKARFKIAEKGKLILKEHAK